MAEAKGRTAAQKGAAKVTSNSGSKLIGREHVKSVHV